MRVPHLALALVRTLWASLWDSMRSLTGPSELLRNQPALAEHAPCHLLMQSQVVLSCFQHTCLGNAGRSSAAAHEGI